MKCKTEKFNTEEKANKVAQIRQLKKRRTRSGHGRKYESYFCNECGYWHVGVVMKNNKKRGGCYWIKLKD